MVEVACMRNGEGKYETENGVVAVGLAVCMGGRGE